MIQLLASATATRSLLVLLMILTCTTANAAPIQRSITISTSSSTDATFSDWTTADNSTTATVAGDWGTATDVTNNSGQFTTDGEYQNPCSGSTDLDCSTTGGGGTGRDLKKFSYTWDSTNLYMYVERFASATSANDWWFYIDSNDNGLMEDGEIVLNVSWTGSNGRTTRQLWTYNEVRSGGDPLTCPQEVPNGIDDGYCTSLGEGDGYDMPGTLTAGATLGTIYGGAEGGSGVDASGNSLDGVAMETYISWTGTSGLNLSGISPVGFHISSSNGTNIPGQLDDNMNGLGATGGGIAFSDTVITKTANVSSIIGGRQFTYTLTVTNNGPSDATNIEVTDEFLPTEITYSSDDSATTSTTTSVVGDTLTWDIPALANGASVALVITMDSDPVTAITTVSNTAEITNQDQGRTILPGPFEDSVDIDLLPTPSLTLLKSVSTFSDPVNASNPKAIPGAYMDYTITATNSGAGVIDLDKTFITDPIPANTDLFVGDLGVAGSGPVAAPASSSTLVYTFTSLNSDTDDIEFSNNNGTDWNYYEDSDFSNIDADGFDSTVTNIRVNPKGTFAGSAGPNPTFSMTFRVRLQ